MNAASRAAMFAFLLSSAGSFAAETAVTSSAPTAAELVEGIVREEAAVSNLRSLFIRMEGESKQPPEAIARRKLEQLKQPAGLRLEPSPSRKVDYELAFDAKRVRTLQHAHEVHRTLSVFDGDLAVRHSKYFTSTQENYELSHSPTAFFEHALLSYSWLRMGAHELWFRKDQFPLAERAGINGHSADYTAIGEEDYRGRRCYLLENRYAHRRAYVGVDDRRLHGLVLYVQPRSADPLPLLEKLAGQPFASHREYAAWFQSLPVSERADVFRKEKAARFALMQPFFEFTLDDYRELAPGFWFPAAQGSLHFEPEVPPGRLASSREMQLVDFKVDQDLPEDLFSIELVEGVQVYDGRYDPPLAYKQKTDRTPEEWQQLIDARKSLDDAWQKEQAQRNELVGKPAPRSLSRPGSTANP